LFTLFGELVTVIDTAAEVVLKPELSLATAVNEKVPFGGLVQTALQGSLVSVLISVPF
jgi:hypothetical protein